MLCLTKYPASGPSSRYRLLQFRPALEARGSELHLHSLHDESHLARRFAGRPSSPLYLAQRMASRLAALAGAKRYDLVFIQKEIFPWLPGFAEWALECSGARLVLDFDDAIFLSYRGRRLLERKFERVVSRCALVLAGNRYLADYAGRFSGRVVMFPTVVDCDRFTPGVASDGEVPVVGWIGTPETTVFLRELGPVLARARQRAPFVLRAVGAGDISIDGVEVDVRPWSEDTEVDDLRAMDVGIMPLPDDEWSRGKCALKLLQYMSTGLATVSSPRGSAAEIITHGDNGFLPADTGEWVECLIDLLADDELRHGMGHRARGWIESNYTLANYGPRLADHLTAAVEGRSLT
jgi:glycosyltransferase involved in cell wall biosynthesis